MHVPRINCHRALADGAVCKTLHRSHAVATQCCLLQNDTSRLAQCPVRETSWKLFSQLRRNAGQDPYFTSCDQFVVRHLYAWEPHELLTLCSAFGRTRSPCTPQLLKRVLWRVDHLVPCLKGADLVRMLQVFSAEGIREHDPKCSDLFRLASHYLAACSETLSAADIKKICTIYRQLGLREIALFELLGMRLVSILEGGFTVHPHGPTCAPDLSTNDLPRKTSMPAPANAAMSFLMSCGRLNILTSNALRLFELVSPYVRATRDVAHLVSLTQLAAKLGFAGNTEATAVYNAVRLNLDSSNTWTPAHRYASQVVYGQLILSLVFDEAPCDAREDTLVAAIAAVYNTFGASPSAMSEQLARQLQVAELACRLERPLTLEKLAAAGLTQFLSDVKELNHGTPMLTKVSSQQHLQVSGALQQLGIKHRLEFPVLPYVADLRVYGGPRLIEIDGPLHFIGQTKTYDLKSTLKHRLLTKQGWEVHHIAWSDWPTSWHSRLNYISKLLRSCAPDASMLEYTPLAERSSNFEDLMEIPTDDWTVTSSDDQGLDELEV